MFFEKSCREVFVVYRILGLVSGQFRFSQSYNIWQILLTIAEHFWIICILIFELYLLKMSFEMWHQKFVHEPNLYSVSFSFGTIVTQILLCAATIESFCKRNTQTNILNNLNDIDHIFSETLNLNVNYFRLRRLIRRAFMKWILVYVIVECLLISLIPIETNEPIRFVDFLLFAMYPMQKLTLIGSKYITYGILIKYRIRTMHEILDTYFPTVHQNRQCISECTTCDNYRSIELRRMLNLQRIFDKIYETIQLTNETFKWSISMVFSICVFVICILLFHVLEFILGPANKVSLSTACINVVIIFYYVSALIMFIQIANDVTNETEKLAVKVHQISLNQTLSKDLLNFVSKIFQQFSIHVYILWVSYSFIYFHYNKCINIYI